MFTPVIGRFAPSPSGPLHFGSLVAALGSYLSARAQGGQWLLRIEDIDPPREPAGARERILSQLQAHGLLWDGEVLLQSTRSTRYDEVLADLRARGLLYACDCPRKRLQAMGGVYDGHCRDRGLSFTQDTAWRVQLGAVPGEFVDRIWGACSFSQVDSDDPVLRRRDGLYAYLLAVVVDDIDQGITEIVRGADLLDFTPKQIALWRLLGATPPQFAHLPLVTQDDGRKLSKQNHAPAIEDADALANLQRALQVLRQTPAVATSLDSLLAAAVNDWRLDSVPVGPAPSSLHQAQDQAFETL